MLASSYLLEPPPSHSSQPLLPPFLPPSSSIPPPILSFPLPAPPILPFVIPPLPPPITPANLPSLLPLSPSTQVVGNCEIVNYLLDNGADVNQTDDMGVSVLNACNHVLFSSHPKVKE